MNELERRARRRRKRRQLRRQRLLLGGASFALIGFVVAGGLVTAHGDAAPERLAVGQAVAAARAATPISCPVPAAFRHAFARASNVAGLEPALLVAVAHAESELEPGAVSRLGARGLLQLMPETARDFGVDARRPADNLAAGARYLRMLLDRFGSLRLALAAYNAGPTTVAKYGGVPPYSETQRYVTEVTGARRLLSGCRFT